MAGVASQNSIACPRIDLEPVEEFIEWKDRPLTCRLQRGLKQGYAADRFVTEANRVGCAASTPCDR